MRALGVDVGGTNTKLVCVGPEGIVEHRESFLTHGDEGPQALVEALAPRLRERLAGDDAPEAVGLAIAALVNARGLPAQAPNLPRLEGFDLRAALEEVLEGRPAVVENDVNAAAFGELRAGAARGARHVVMLSLGTGVGGGLILDGSLHRGVGGMAAELGHMVLDYEGPACTCGQPGHVESYLSSRSFVELAREFLGRGHGARPGPLARRIAAGDELSCRLLSETAAEGDPVAREVLADRGRLLGIAAASLVNAFNPEILVVGGGVSASGEWLLGPARQALLERAMPAPAAQVRLTRAELGGDGAAVGAALLALEERPDRGLGSA